ncbi:MAG TPA: 2,3-bisphosphoglycerate-independent phosphoglycerate mutase [Clostridiaceae bacterium]|nr:2,3-bisphosphoglycerate-independent phosphoglycerate mutase [Clostridiaceae bacterium]
MKKRPVALIILDGYGLNPEIKGNAVANAYKPNLDSFIATYPNTRIYCSGLDVGLPKGQMGNSEVGHTNIGAGRVVYQELTRITKSIEDGDFFEREEFLGAIENCKKHGTKLHLFGLLSDGGVHSHNTHLYALVELAARHNLKDVYIHNFFDGRDVPPDSAIKYVEELEEKLASIGTGKIASLMGRYYAMDRDNRWERVKLAYDAMVMGQGIYSDNAIKAVKESYAREEYDEFVKPVVIVENGRPVSTIGENDSIIFYNFRPDRAREITRAFVDEDFKGFERPKGFFPVYYVCMTQYDKTMPNVKVAYKPESLENTFGEYISKLGYKQLRIAETEKYAHVTFFFNGGVEKMYEGEDRVLVPSPKVATYDLKPEMSAYEVTEEVLKRIDSEKYDVIVLNFANCDMVGHTGVYEAAKAAVEAIDKCLGRIVPLVLKKGGVALITADHGNAEQMIDPDTGGSFTAHTINPVPLICIGLENIELKEGRLADLAPTMLDIMEIEKPPEMTGQSLIVKK